MSPLGAAQTVRALWIDDEPQSVRRVACLLQEHGIDTEVIGDPVVGLARALEGGFDVVLLDERMPRMTGREILAELRRQAVRSPIIVVTGYASLDSAVAAIKVGAADYLSKPCRAEAVLSAVRRALVPAAPARTGAGTPVERQDRLDTIVSALDELERASPYGSWPALGAVLSSQSDLRAHVLRALARRLADRRLGIGEYLATAKAFTVMVSSSERPDADMVRRVRHLLTVRRREGNDERLSFLFAVSDRWRDVRRSAVAAHLGIEIERVDRELFDELGVGFVQLRMHLAIRRAIILLAETDLQLKHIADDVGYGHPSAFTRDFEHCVVVAPTIFRQWLGHKSSG